LAVWDMRPVPDVTTTDRDPASNDAKLTERLKAEG
jgi:hypothetical protein